MEKENNKSRRRQEEEEEETLSNSMENTDDRGLFQQNPPVNLLNPTTFSFENPYPSSYMDAYYAPFENPNPFPVQSWDSNSQIEVIHPPGVEPPPTVTHISSACGTLPPYPTFTYLQNQAIASTSPPVHHYYHDPNVYPALPPIGIGITEPATVTGESVATSSLSMNVNFGPQKGGIINKGPKKTKIIGSAWWCEICKIDCNNKSILDQHKLGKKHKRNLWKLAAENGCILTQSLAATPAQVPTPANILAPTTSFLPSIILSNVQKARKKAAANEDLATKTRKMLEGGVAAKDVRMCTKCNVVCNSEMVFMHHLAGQKHAAMMNMSSFTNGIFKS